MSQPSTGPTPPIEPGGDRGSESGAQGSPRQTPAPSERAPSEQVVPVPRASSELNDLSPPPAGRRRKRAGPPGDRTGAGGIGHLAGRPGTQAADRRYPPGARAAGGRRRARAASAQQDGGGRLVGRGRPPGHGQPGGPWGRRWRGRGREPRGGDCARRHAPSLEEPAPRPEQPGPAPRSVPALRARGGPGDADGPPRGSLARGALRVPSRRRHDGDRRQRLHGPGAERPAGHGGRLRRHRDPQERRALPRRRALRHRRSGAGHPQPAAPHRGGAAARPDDPLPGHQEPDRGQGCPADPGGVTARSLRGARPEQLRLRHLQAPGRQRAAAAAQDHRRGPARGPRADHPHRRRGSLGRRAAARRRGTAPAVGGDRSRRQASQVALVCSTESRIWPSGFCGRSSTATTAP